MGYSWTTLANQPLLEMSLGLCTSIPPPGESLPVLMNAASLLWPTLANCFLVRRAPWIMCAQLEPEQAVACAVEIQRRMRELSPKMAASRGTMTDVDDCQSMIQDTDRMRNDESQMTAAYGPALRSLGRDAPAAVLALGDQES